jgi:SAM-dependent methyltransferase
MVGVLHENRSRAESFGSVAELYDRVRPSYPPALLDDLLTGGVVDVLDVGCGTGIAAALLAARGAMVLGVEIDERMAAQARAKGIAVEVAPFELWDDAGRRFDLVVSGQAWHWVEPHAGATKAARVLRPGGRIGLFWNLGGPPAEVRERLAPVYDRLEPELENYSVALGNRSGRDRDTVAGLEESGLFGGSRSGASRGASHTPRGHGSSSCRPTAITTHFRTGGAAGCWGRSPRRSRTWARSRSPMRRC